MKKKFLYPIIWLLLFSLTACGSPSKESSSAETPTQESTAPAVVPGDTIASVYLATFANSSSEGAQASVDEMVALNLIETELVEMEVTEGYLDGFSDEISGFSHGVKFSPMIGSIPFVGYVFETDQPEVLLQQLTDLADPAWNICTKADETVSYIRGNQVFFLMCPDEKA